MPDKIRKLLTQELKKDPQIVFAYLFGSFVKHTGPHQDLDVALMLTHELHGLDKLKFINNITDQLEKKLKNKIDIVILNTAPVALKQQVVKYGFLLFTRKKKQHKDFLFQTMTEYFDYLQILNFFYAKSTSKPKRSKHG